MFIYLLVLFNNWTPFKDALSGLRQFLPNESPLIRMKNAFYFTLKILFVLKIFKFLTSIFGHVEKPLNWKNKVNFKIYDITTWETNNCKIHCPISQELKTVRK